MSSSTWSRGRSRSSVARRRRRRGRAFVFLPRGVPHAWDVVSDEATVLLLTVPPGLEEFLGEYHTASGPARDDVAAKYGIEFLHG